MRKSKRSVAGSSRDSPSQVLETSPGSCHFIEDRKRFFKRLDLGLAALLALFEANPDIITGWREVGNVRGDLLQLHSCSDELGPGGAVLVEQVREHVRRSTGAVV